MILASLALAQAVIPAPAQSSVFMTGNTLYEECQRPNNSNCVGYIMAVSDTLTDGAAMRRGSSNLCVSAGVEITQLVDVVISFLRDHPQHRHASASSIVIYALERAFPCRIPTRGQS